MELANYKNLSREQIFSNHGKKLGELIWVHLCNIRDDNQESTERDITRFIAMSESKNNV